MEAVRQKSVEHGPVGPKKQIGFYLPNADWLRLRRHSAERGLPITGVCWELLQPLLEELRRKEDSAE